MNRLTSSILYSLFVEHQNKNWVFSPASYLEAMAGLALCLKGKALEELTALAPDLGAPQTAGLEGYNALFYSAEYREALVQSVVDALAARGGELRPFVGAEVVDEVNRIVREKTHGKIDGLLQPSDLTEFTKLILLNCVYFKRDWQYPFREDSTERPFHGATAETQVRFLSKQEPWRYYEDGQIDVVELPYRDSDVACYLVVPKDSLLQVFADLPHVMRRLGQVRHQLECHVIVPPFKTESTFPSLSTLTRAAGLSIPFAPSKDWSILDFTRLDPAAVLWVQSIIQKAYLDFTEKGTEAAAATSILIGLSGCCMMPPIIPPPVKVICADKPFLYVLANRADPSKPFFVGVVNDVPASGPRNGWPDFKYTISSIDGLSGIQF